MICAEKMASFAEESVNFTQQQEYADTLLAYFSEFIDSSKLVDDGLMQQIISVLALPPRESCHTIHQHYFHLSLAMIKSF